MGISGLRNTSHVPQKVPDGIKVSIVLTKANVQLDDEIALPEAKN